MHNNSLQLTRLACGKLERDLPARWRENESTVARAAGQLPLASSGCYAKLEAVRRHLTLHREEITMEVGPLVCCTCTKVQSRGTVWSSLLPSGQTRS